MQEGKSPCTGLVTTALLHLRDACHGLRVKSETSTLHSEMFTDIEDLKDLSVPSNGT